MEFNSNKKKNFVKALPFILPFMIVYLVFLVFPIIRGFWMSLHRWTIVRKMHFVGLSNYIEMFQDSSFWSSFGNTMIFVLVSTPTIVLAGLVLALICNQKIRGKLFLKIAFFLPYVLSVAVISSIMVYLFQTNNGFINMFLEDIGVISNGIQWLSQDLLAWFVIVFATLWWTVGFNMILYLAALQDIPESYYEAASVDGATQLEQFLYITLPQLKPITWVIVLLQIIFSYKVFAQIWLITGGGPGTSTRPIIQYIYETSFRQNSLGYGATMSFTIFVILIIISVAQIVIRRKRSDVQ
ncbi:carbohydrate ABC transporter permease [Halanaerobium hydrogeniformans]|uniref:Binding-protein-dependent transport systems inner membrane component n=1 Tax=Halanaerobium hydrogeniformans TaxID=656519 RepID=E4RNE4_HALHG|nr:sugar ABC transporter permease [Halanaerobium hydrogeniformans]ADQ13612.1 binding-protein-dependent transport systems inner membrane component [Halanaerobium hydrogeniformans]